MPLIRSAAAILLVVILCGCSLAYVRRDGTQGDRLRDAAEGAANGFIAGGPIGALEGALVPLVAGLFAVRHERKKRQHAEAHYLADTGHTVPTHAPQHRIAA